MLMLMLLDEVGLGWVGHGIRQRDMLSLTSAGARSHVQLLTVGRLLV
jgi:hypothetical protein